MPRFKFQDIHSIEKAPGSPTTLRNKVSEMIGSSKVCRAKVEAINSETGEYRVVLQGTLDREASRIEEK